MRSFPDGKPLLLPQRRNGSRSREQVYIGTGWLAQFDRSGGGAELEYRENQAGTVLPARPLLTAIATPDSMLTVLRVPTR